MLIEIIIFLKVHSTNIRRSIRFIRNRRKKKKKERKKEEKKRKKEEKKKLNETLLDENLLKEH